MTPEQQFAFAAFLFAVHSSKEDGEKPGTCIERGLVFSLVVWLFLAALHQVISALIRHA